MEDLGFGMLAMAILVAIFAMGNCSGRDNLASDCLKLEKFQFMGSVYSCTHAIGPKK